MSRLEMQRVSFNRTADTNAYGALDVIGAAVANGGGILSILPANASGRSEVANLVSASFLSGANAVPAGMTTIDLHLFNASPAAAAGNGDNGAFDLVLADRDAYLGKIQFAAPDDRGSTIFSDLHNIQKLLYLPTGALYGVLVTTVGFTPASATPVRVELGLEVG